MHLVRIAKPNGNGLAIEALTGEDKEVVDPLNAYYLSEVLTQLSTEPDLVASIYGVRRRQQPTAHEVSGLSTATGQRLTGTRTSKAGPD
ncbi:hypothetical protein [Pseudomonas sp. PNPG3]|uniref:hypothetical protein n=1 Tax=Pseudomonas sp. PNPG3 TaxID=2919497 RepID=UPI001FFD2836|nr:hypothetical protein [Pseudomonas sp. PNPG3]MCK2122121.1 hypothetical protein [Pseudomonas sp. PNPG3]